MDTKPMMLEGGCLCGAVRYRIAGNAFHRTLCHCTDCRRASGAPAVAWFSVTPETFEVVEGSPQRYRSSASATRSFCAACGTSLTYRSDNLPEIDVTTCSLDAPEALPPEDQTFVRSRLTWMPRVCQLPEHQTIRSHAAPLA